MKHTKIIVLSLVSASFLFGAPNVGDVEKQVVVPKVVAEKEAKEASAIPVIKPEELREPMMEEGGKQIEVKGFKLSGATHVSEDKLFSRINGYAGKSYTFSELQKITSLITKAYREEGYFVARAYIPKQSMSDGMLEIAIIEGNYGEFKLSNSSSVDNQSVQAMLDDIKDANIVSVDTLERAMLIINDTPGVKVSGADVMPGSKVGTSDFAITTEATEPYSAYIIADNYGSKYTGRYTANVGVSANSPLGYSDKFGINGVMSTTTDLKNGKVYYNFPLMANGLRGELAASKTTYSLAEDYAALDALGHSTTLEASLSYPLIRTREESLKISLGYAHKNMEDEVQSTSTLTKKESDAINLGATYSKNCILFGLPSSTTATLTLTAGNLDSPTNLDTDGSYSKISGSVEKSLQFNPELSLTTSLRFQKAIKDKNLDGSEDFSLGGAYGVRAFPDGEHSAENGYIVGAELFYALPSVEGINHKASIFADTGYASMQNNNGTSEGRQLSDVGLGYQANYKEFFAKAQVARVVGGEKVESETNHSTKLLLQVGWLY